MKLATVQIDGAPCAAALQQNRLALLAPGTDLGALLRQGLGLADFQRLAAAATIHVDPNQAVFLSPSIEPPKILCVGLNYADHTKESPYEQPDYPTLFLRVATSLGAHNAIVHRPALSDSLDFEGEMVVVLGKGGRDIPKDRALEHVFGYAAGNDLGTRVPVQVAAMDGRQELRRHRRLGPLRGHGRRAAAGRARCAWRPG